MKRTNRVILILIFLALGWEAFTLLNTIPNDTISESVWDATAENPIITFLAGILCGHWFWQRKQK